MTCKYYTDGKCTGNRFSFFCIYAVRNAENQITCNADEHLKAAEKQAGCVRHE